jgi:hypothetical protein
MAMMIMKRGIANDNDDDRDPIENQPSQDSRWRANREPINIQEGGNGEPIESQSRPCRVIMQRQ